MSTFADYRGRHAGETIVVCGCGRSLLDLPEPRRLVTIGVNDVGRLFDPTYLVVVNPRGQFRNGRFGYVEASNATALFTQLDLGRVRPPVVRFKLGKYGGTELGDDGALHYTQNSPYVAVCLAAYMGASRIGLIGVDLTDDHFFAPTGPHCLAGRAREIDEQYARLAAALARRGVELVNLSARSRLVSLPRASAADPLATAPQARRRIVSYATTPVAGVPAILAECIATETPHEATCVWSSGDYGNGVRFAGGVSWRREPSEAMRLLQAADVVIVHNGKVDPLHRGVIEGKPVVTMAHNYAWNVDLDFARRGAAVVVGQYQATLPEFATWPVVPNPIPLRSAEYSPEEKAEAITIAYTPSGRHERYPAGHRLYWHGKGYDTTLRVLERLARTRGVRLETTAHAQVSHAEALAMKRRAHIVIDECVTGSYHRNSLEGLAAGCVVVNGVGILPGVAEVLQRCAPGAADIPFVHATLETLEETLLRLVDGGPEALVEHGRRNRQWMERHWAFADQWPRFWEAACDPRRAKPKTARSLAAVARPPAPPRPKPMPQRPTPTRKESAMKRPVAEPVSIVIPHGGAERLPHLAAALANLRQRSGVREIVVVELGGEPVARELCSRWADKHVFIPHDGPFDRARALNAGHDATDGAFVLWHDNDLLAPDDFLFRATEEIQSRALDFLIPYTSVRYLGSADTARVMRGEADPSRCKPENVLFSRVTPFGAMGLVRREFVARHGGLIEGFRGWGGEDNAWNHKVSVLGRFSRTQRNDQHVHHLHHPGCNGSQPGEAAKANPFYAQNVALMKRVFAMRSPAGFSREFPPAAAARGDVTVFAPSRSQPVPSGPCVWAYWEGPEPEWIRACLRTIAAAAPHVCILTRGGFERLWDRDRDIDIARLDPARRADFIRAFLLHRHGGLWIDADCLVMKPLRPVLDLLASHDFVGHRERQGAISNAFIAARPGSRIAAAFYQRVCAALRSRRPLGWTALGAEPLSAVVAENAAGWHELPCESVQPICWSEPAKFFAHRTPEGHEAAFDDRALCYMLANEAIKRHSANPEAELMHPESFFSFLRARAPAGESEANATPYRDIFSAHADMYRSLGGESISGPGSSRHETRELRERLPLALESLGVRSLVDAPCGDMNWMREARLGVESYVGVDILGELIAEHAGRLGSPRRRFVRADLTRDPLPRADAILSRDFLTHLSFDDIAAALRNFRRSGATYLLTTTFTRPRPNRDTSQGEWRTLNLTMPPFDFPPPELLIDEKCTENGGAYADKCLAVWRLADLPLEAEEGEAHASVAAEGRFTA